MEEFERSEIAERLVRTHGVVDMFPAAKLGIELRNVPVLGDHLIELLVVSAMRPFDVAVEFWRAWREHEERQVSSLASQLEFGSEFAAAIHLHGGDGEGHAIDQRIQEVSGGERSGAFVNFQDIPTRDHVASREMFEHDSAHRPHLFGVELNQISRLSNGPKTWFSPGPGTASHLSATGWYLGDRFHQHAATLQIAQDPAHHGGGKPEVFAAEQHDQFVLPPAGILAPQREDGFALRGGPGRLATPMRTVRAIFQTGEIVRVIAAPPAIERLPADPKVTAGERRIATVAKIVTHPGQPELASPAQLAPKARELSRFGYPSPSYLHSDTLPSVTNHSEREHPAFAVFRLAGEKVNRAILQINLLDAHRSLVPLNPSDQFDQTEFLYQGE